MMHRMKYSFSSLLCLLIVMGLASCKPKLDRKIRHLETKLEQTADPKEFAETAMQLHRLYSLYQIEHPGDTSHLLDWAELARKGRENEIAVKCYDQYLNIHKDPSVFELRGNAKLQLGFFEDAAQDYHTAANRVKYPANRKRLLQLYQYNAGLDSLLEQINDELDENINIPENRLSRAGIFLHNGHPNAAKYDIDQVLQQYPDHIEAWYFLALLKKQYNDYTGSLEDLKRYFELAGENHSYRSKARDLQNEINRRIKLAELESRLGKNPDNYTDFLEMGRLYFDLKEYRAASETFTRAVRLRPDSLLGWLYRGQAHIQLGRLGQAMQDLHKALESDPENLSAHNLKAYVHLLRGESELVRKEVEWIREHKGEVLDILDQYLDEQ